MIRLDASLQQQDRTHVGVRPNSSNALDAFRHEFYGGTTTSGADLHPQNHRRSDQPNANATDTKETAEQAIEQASQHFIEGNYSQAEAAWLKALNVYQKVCGPNSPEVRDTLLNLGNNCNLQGRYTDGEKYTNQAIEISKRQGTSGEVSLGALLGNLAESYIGQGKLDKAYESYAEALKVLEKNLLACKTTNDLMENKVVTRIVLNDFAKFLEQRQQGNDLELAKQLRERAEKIHRQLQQQSPNGGKQKPADLKGTG
ncbi:MAG: tetratricopeptide repeat protein [Candidatus Melainabacteria bacterium]|nr:tetratricopeptide repeat protein [Candidatus Melainabacteria bacterium]